MTLGQKRVKAKLSVEFNPEKNEMVDLIKNKSAELIDLCQEMTEIGLESERNRLIELAQTKYEEAAMFAVKAIFAD